MPVTLAAPERLPTAAPQRHVLNGETMGTRYAVIFYSEVPFDRAALKADLQAAVDRVDDQMSPWKPDSVLCRFNNAQPGTWMDLPEETFDVVYAALRTCQESGGAFDPFVGELITAWGFGPGNAKLGTATALDPRETWGTRAREVELDRPARRLRRLSDCRLDLCGIAKGYGVDRLSRVMRRWGFADHLVSIDGEVRGSGAKPDGSPWRVALEEPVEGVRSSTHALELSGTAIATSGTYRQVRTHGGRTVSHTMHPLQGCPVNNGLLSVSVVADSCMDADAWATAFLVLGAGPGLTKARETCLDAIFMFRNASGQIDMIATDPGLLPDRAGQHSD